MIQEVPVRVYVPATMRLLVEMLDREAVPADLGYALTPALREWYVEGDDEELEYAAMICAARASLQLLAKRPDDPHRRVVLALEVPDATAVPRPDVDRAAVSLETRPSLSHVVSAHVDDLAAEPDVTAALPVLAAAADGDEDAEFLVDAVEDHELAWYAAQEIAALVGVDAEVTSRRRPDE
jgi:hypothetical protein